MKWVVLFVVIGLLGRAAQIVGAKQEIREIVREEAELGERLVGCGL